MVGIPQFLMYGSRCGRTSAATQIPVAGARYIINGAFGHDWR